MTEPTSGGEPKSNVSLPAISPEKIGGEGSMGEHAVVQLPATPTSSEVAKVSSVSQERKTADSTFCRSSEELEKHHVQQSVEKKHFEQRVEDAKASVASLVPSTEKPKIADVFFRTRKHEMADRECLKRIRKHAQESLKTEKAEEVSRHFSEELNAFIAQIYNDGVESLEKQFHLTPPCHYCVVALGSLARGESGPYPDFDNLIVVERVSPESDRFFKLLTQYVADRLERLGESEQTGLERLGEEGSSGSSGVHICRGLSVPYVAYNFRFERTQETIKRDIEALSSQIESLKNSLNPSDIRTRETLERVLQSSREELNKPHPKGGREFLIDVHSWSGPPELWGDVTCGIPIFGTDRGLYDKFKGSFTKRSPRELVQKAVERQTQDMQARDPLLCNPIVASTVPPVVHIKEDLLRLPSVLRVLALVNGIEELSTVRCIELLQKKGKLPPDLAEKLIVAMNFALKWRIQVQLEHKREFELVTTRLGEGNLESFKKELAAAISQLDVQIQLLRSRQATVLEGSGPLEQAESNRRRYRDMLENDLREVEGHPEAFSELDVRDLTTRVIPALKQFYQFLLMETA